MPYKIILGEELSRITNTDWLKRLKLKEPEFSFCNSCHISYETGHSGIEGMIQSESCRLTQLIPLPPFQIAKSWHDILFKEIDRKKTEDVCRKILLSGGKNILEEATKLETL